MGMGSQQRIIVVENERMTDTGKKDVYGANKKGIVVEPRPVNIISVNSPSVWFLTQRKQG